jgi:bacteriorhodopsin
MPVTTDIVRMYRGPRRVVRDLLVMGQREDRAIMWLMIGCLIVFLSRLPALQREAILGQGDFSRDAAYAFFGLMMIAPLMFYGLAAVGRGVARLAGGRPSGYGARLALFWSWLAATPLILFYGLLAGMNGAAAAGTQAIGLLWVVVFAVFWVQGLREASENHDA